jgi:hypothetical protein
LNLPFTSVDIPTIEPLITTVEPGRGDLSVASVTAPVIVVWAKITEQHSINKKIRKEFFFIQFEF